MSEMRTYLRFIALELRDAWNLYCSPIPFVWRFLTRPFTDLWKVARGHPDVLPEREGIGWLAGISLSAYLGVAGAIRNEAWGWLTFFIVVYVVVYIIRTYIMDDHRFGQGRQRVLRR